MVQVKKNEALMGFDPLKLMEGEVEGQSSACRQYLELLLCGLEVLWHFRLLYE